MKEHSMGSNATLIALAALSMGCIGKDTEPERLDRSECTKSGIICTIAGTGNSAYNLQNDQALDTALNRPSAVNFAPDGQLLINDSLNLLIRKLQDNDILITVAGNRKATYAQVGPATQSPLKTITDIAQGPGSMFYLAESEGPRVLGLDMSSDEAQISILAGTSGLFGFEPDDPDIAPMDTLLDRINGLAVGPDGVIYMSMGLTDSTFGVIRAFDPADVDEDGVAQGMVWTVVGADADGYSNGALSNPQKMSFHDGALYVADAGVHGIAKVDVDTGDLEWVAGAVTGDKDTIAEGTSGYGGDDGPMDGIVLNTPYSVIFDGGKMIIADSGNDAIRAQLDSGSFDTISGRGPSGYAGDGEAAENASLNFPQDVAVGPDGDFYIADTNNAVIRWIASPSW
jgi:glucose/arabinose dehydrogenase